MYSLVSLFLSVIFFWTAWTGIASWDLWENIPLIILAIFFLAAGSYGLSQIGKANKDEQTDTSASREIAIMIILIVALAIALWVMFRFGFQ